MDLEPSDYVAGGYFLTKPFARDDNFMSAELLPPTIYSLSSCLGESAFEYWWSVENVEQALDFGVPADRLSDLVAWYTGRFRTEFGAPNVAFSRRVIREFVDRFLEDPTGLILLGCALSAGPAARLLAEHRTRPELGEYGVFEMIERGEPIAPGGEILGYEVLSYEYGLEHSWLCGGLERKAHDALGITPGRWGLLARHSDADDVAQFANRVDVPTEPGSWFPWLVLRYPLHPANS